MSGQVATFVDCHRTWKLIPGSPAVVPNDSCPNEVNAYIFFAIRITRHTPLKVLISFLSLHNYIVISGGAVYEYDMVRYG
jgi:hypothetical protein